MKKTIIFLIAILLLQTLPIGFSAEEAQYETVFDLLQLWGENGYPDYVCGIWSNDGSIYNLSVGIVEGEDGEKGKAKKSSLWSTHPSTEDRIEALKNII